VPAIGCRGEGGPEEIAAAGEGMVLVPPRDPDALAETIAELLDQPEHLDALGQAARATAVEQFSWERCGEATVAAYERALAEGPR
jgi:glycosyltransferase involved in cell wall biosynthesis